MQDGRQKIFRSVVFYGMLVLLRPGVSAPPYRAVYLSRIRKSQLQYVYRRYRPRLDKSGCLIAVEIATDVWYTKQPSVQVIEGNMERLNRWYPDLPLMMQLAMLNGKYLEIFSYFQKRSVLLVYRLSFGAMTLLHRPVLIAIANSQLAGIWELDSTAEECCVYQEYCFIAAQQASRIAAIPKHCWIIMWALFYNSIQKTQKPRMTLLTKDDYGE